MSVNERAKKFSAWVKDGIKENFTPSNIRKINSALATFLINILASLGLLVIATAMLSANTLITVVIVSIWASFEGFLSVAIIALFGSKGDTFENTELMQMFKKTIEVPSDENLMELKDMIKGTIEETFVPEEELKEFYETDTEEEAEVEAEAVVEPEPEPEAEPATEIEPETEAEVPQ